MPRRFRKHLTRWDRLDERLKDMDISRRDLADYVGVSYSTVDKWVSGVSRPSDEHMSALCEALYIDQDELIGDMEGAWENYE